MIRNSSFPRSAGYWRLKTGRTALADSRRLRAEARRVTRQKRFLREQMVNWSQESILVTGGTGSFGKKFVETMLRESQPQRLVVFSRDELKQNEMRTSGFDHPNLRYFIGGVRDVERLKRARAGVTVVVHAAALKQVP